MLDFHYEFATQCAFVDTDCLCWTGLTAVQISLLLKMMHDEEENLLNKEETVEQLKSSKKWANIPLANRQNM